jgi:hypothetical protein
MASMVISVEAARPDLGYFLVPPKWHIQPYSRESFWSCLGGVVRQVLLSRSVCVDGIWTVVTAHRVGCGVRAVAHERNHAHSVACVEQVVPVQLLRPRDWLLESLLIIRCL